MRFLIVKGQGANFDPEAIEYQTKIPVKINQVDPSLKNQIDIFDCGQSIPTEGWDDKVKVGKCNAGDLDIPNPMKELFGDDQTRKLVDFFNTPIEGEGEE